MASSADWPDARCARLERLWLQQEPHLTTTQIGMAMGITKNAVVGKAKRLGLPARPSPIRRPEGNQRPRPQRPAVVPLACLAELPPPPPPEPARPKRPATSRCEWPMWAADERPSHVLCDEPVISGRYCKAHNEVAFVRRASRQAA